MTDPSKQSDSNSVPDDSNSQSPTPAKEPTQQDAQAEQQTDPEASSPAEPSTTEPPTTEPSTTEPSTTEPSAAETPDSGQPPAPEPAPEPAASSSETTAVPGEATSDSATAAPPLPANPSTSEPSGATAADPLPEPPLAPQATTPGYTEPIPGARRPRGSRRGVLVAVTLVAVLLLVICGVVGYLFLQQTSENNAHKAGKCVTQSGTSAKPADCDDKDAYKIIKRLNNTQSDKGCPASQTELYFVNESSDYVLCLKKNNPQR